jgi:hypothetical protein
MIVRAFGEVRDMKSLIATIAIVLALASSARADERVGQAALGAISGGLVFGPVGLVAGAVVGYTAGPSIAHSWRANRSEPRRSAQRVKRPAHVAVSHVKSRSSAPGTVTPAPGVGGPPVQGLE